MPNLLLFDFDNTLAPTQDHFSDSFRRRMYEVVSGIQPMTPEEFVQRSREITRVHKADLFGWMHELGYGREAAVNFIQETAEVMLASIRPHVEPNDELTARLEEASREGHVLAILTHNHMDYMLPALELVGLSHLFVPERIFDVTTNGATLKLSAATYRHVLEKLGALYTFTGKVMVEDSAENLLAARETGFTTVYVNQKKPLPPEYAASVDHTFPGILPALDFLLQNLQN